MHKALLHMSRCFLWHDILPGALSPMAMDIFILCVNHVCALRICSTSAVIAEGKLYFAHDRHHGFKDYNHKWNLFAASSSTCFCQSQLVFCVNEKSLLCFRRWPLGEKEILIYNPPETPQRYTHFIFLLLHVSIRWRLCILLLYSDFNLNCTIYQVSEQDTTGIFNSVISQAYVTIATEAAPLCRTVSRPLLTVSVKSQNFTKAT